MGLYGNRISGSDKSVFMGGIETVHHIYTSGSAYALHNIEASGNLIAAGHISGSDTAFFVGGIEAFGNVETSGSLYASSSAEINGFVKVLGIGNSTTISKPMTIPANYNSVLYGPITIAETLTITSTAAVKIKDIADA